MKKYLSFILIAIFVFLSLEGNFAYCETENKETSPVVVRVGYCEALGLMNGASEDAVKSGYAYDVLQEMAKYTGWHYEYVYGDFGTLLNKLENNEIDILPGVAKNDDRMDKMLFPEYRLGEENYYITKAVDNYDIDIENISTLNNKVIGVGRSVNQINSLRKFINENNINLKIIEYDIKEDRWNDLKNGVVDLSLDSDSALTKGISCVKKLETTDYYFAVNKIRPDLLTEINSTMKLLNDSKPYFITSLYQSYFNNAFLFNSLTSVEKQWLDNHKNIVIGALSNDIPYSFYNDEGEATGAVPELINYMFNAIYSDINITWKLYDNSSDLYKALMDGEIDILSPIFNSLYDAERWGFGISDTIMNVPMGMIYSKNKSIDEIEKIAITGKDIVIAEKIKKNLFPNYEIIVCDTFKECISLLTNENVDGIVSHSFAVNSVQKSVLNDYEVLIFSDQYDVCVAARTDNLILLNIINKARMYVDDSFVHLLEVKYAYAYDNFNINIFEYLKYHPEYIIFVFMIFVMLVVSIILLFKYKNNQKKMLVDKHIIKKLSESYASIGYFKISDSDDGLVIAHFITNNVFTDIIPNWREEDNFYKRLELLNEYCVCAEDKDLFAKATTKEKILKEISNYSTYTINFRVKIDEKLIHYQIRFFTEKVDLKKVDGLVVGLLNVDEEVKFEEDYKRELEVAKEKAENANNAKTQFLFNMSHDIRTPMNAIKGFTDMALKNINNEKKVSDCLSKINTAEEQLLKLINDVLDLSKIESGKLEINNTGIDLRTISNNCASIISGQLIDRDIKFSLNLGESENYRVKGDELRLRQVFVNVLGNSVKFTNDGGKIDFSIRELRKSLGTVWFEFKISDTGIGIHPDFLEHIFEPFEQEHKSARTEYKGTGLGMSICYKLVTLMGGRIDVSSEVGYGTSFTIVIPFEIDDSENEDVVKNNSISYEKLKGIKILLAEDNVLNQEIAIDMLEDEGCKVTCADDGKQVVSMFANSNPGDYDIILMDIMMPNMDGYQATSMIRSLKRDDALTIPIIAISANVFSEDINKAIESGMNDFISKPISVENMRSIIAKYL